MSKKSLVASLAGVSVLAILLAACSSDPATSTPDGSAAPANSSATGLLSSPTMQAIVDAGKMRACIDPEFKPQVYLDENNQPAGVDVELTQALAEGLGVEIEWVQTTFDGLIANIQSGKCDIAISGVTPRGKRALAVTFAKPTMVSNEVLLVAAGESRTTRDQFNTAESNFCYQPGTGSETDTKKYFPNTEQTSLTGAQECILQVLSGKSTAFLTDSATAAGAVAEHPELKAVAPEGVDLPSAPSGPMVPLGDLAFASYLNVFFGEFINNGLYMPICEKYFGDTCDLQALLAQRGNF